MCAYNRKFYLVGWYIYWTWAPIWSIYGNGPKKQGVLWNYRLKWLQVEELVENKESSFSVEEDFVSDDDATHSFSQKERNDLVCVHLRMVKLLLGQQSGFTKFPRYHGRWDAAMTDYCWTLKRETYLLLIFQGVPRNASPSYIHEWIWNNHDERLINFCNIFWKNLSKVEILCWHPISDFWFSDNFFKLS